jgi:hypothetical protein
MQSSYWRRVKYLRDIYIYNSEEHPHESEDTLIKRSIEDYIELHHCHYATEHIYMELNNIRNTMEEPKSIEEAMILLGQQWEAHE